MLSLTSARADPLQDFDRLVSDGEQAKLSAQSLLLKGPERELALVEMDELLDLIDTAWERLEQIDLAALPSPLRGRYFRLRGQLEGRRGESKQAARSLSAAVSAAAPDSRARALALLELYRLSLRHAPEESDQLLAQLAAISSQPELALEAVMVGCYQESKNFAQAVIINRSLISHARAQGRPGAALRYQESLIWGLHSLGQEEQALALARASLREALSRREANAIRQGYEAVLSLAGQGEPSLEEALAMVDGFPPGEAKARFLYRLMDNQSQQRILPLYLREARELKGKPDYYVRGLLAQARLQVETSFELASQSLAEAHDLTDSLPENAKKQQLKKAIFHQQVEVYAGQGDLRSSEEAAEKAWRLPVERNQEQIDLALHGQLIEAALLQLDLGTVRRYAARAIAAWAELPDQRKSPFTMGSLLRPLGGGSLELLLDPYGLSLAPVRAGLSPGSSLLGEFLSDELQGSLLAQLTSSLPVEISPAFNAYALAERSRLLTSLRRPHEAEALLIDGLAKLANLDHPEQIEAVVELRLALSEVWMAGDQLGKARSQLELALAHAGMDSRARRETLYNLARVDSGLGQSQQALEWLLQIENPRLHHQLETVALLLNLERYEQALSSLQTLLADWPVDRSQDFKAFVLQRRCQRLEAVLQARLGRFPEAEAAFSRLSTSPAQQDPLFASALLWEWSKARQLEGRSDALEPLRQAVVEYALVRQRLDPSLLAFGSPLLAFEDELRSYGAARGVTLVAGTLDPGAVEPLADSALLSQADFVSAYSRLRAAHPSVDASMRLELGSLADLSSELEAGQILLHLLPLPEAVALISVHRDGLQLRTVQVPPEALRRLARDFASPNTDASRLAQDSRVLSSALLGPILRRHGDLKELLLLEPSRPWYLPWDALPDLHGQPLYRSCKLTLLASPTRRRVNNGEFSAGQFLVVGGRNSDLDGSQSEVRDLLARYPKALRPEAEQPLPEQLARLAPQAAVVHLSGHGNSTEGRFELSALDFGQQSLGLAEILALPWRPGSLVVLAACRTSGAEDGPVFLHLASAFIASGAGDAIGTLWEVDDRATSVFVAAFYEELFESGDIAQALGVGRDALRSAPRYAHPYYWAAFVHYGGL